PQANSRPRHFPSAMRNIIIIYILTMHKIHHILGIILLLIGSMLAMPYAVASQGTPAVSSSP
ncbi:MAG: hypothetical protein Q8Q03_00915, partial [bacterium]|nr:hypothetical protein [bacterium]